jgi:hypothetical protein
LTLEKESERLKKAAANQQHELVKANARAKAFKQATSSQSYSGMAGPTLQTEQQVPALQLRPPSVLAAAVSPLNGIESVLARMEARMEPQDKKMELLMSLSRMG